MDLVIRRPFLPLPFTHPKVTSGDEKAKSVWLAPLRGAKHYLRTVDGIDDLSTLIALLLDAIGKAAVTLGVVAFGTPFTAAATAGAISETRERIANYRELLETMHAHQGAIIEQLMRDGCTDEQLATARHLFAQTGAWLRLDASSREHTLDTPRESRSPAAQERPREIARQSTRSIKVASDRTHASTRESEVNAEHAVEGPGERAVGSRGGVTAPQHESRHANHAETRVSSEKQSLESQATMDKAVPVKGVRQRLRRVFHRHPAHVDPGHTAPAHRDPVRQQKPSGRPWERFDREVAKASAAVGLTERTAYNRSRFQRLDDQRKIDHIERNGIPLGAAAMGGMTGALCVKAWQSIMQLVASGTASNAAIAAVTSGLGIAASAVFAAAQVVMAAYAATKLAAGTRRNTLFKRYHRDLLALHAQVPPEVLRSAREEVARLRRYNRHVMSFAALTVVGQTAMFTGGVCAATVVGAPAGIPLLAVGAPTTIAGAVQRIVAEKKLSKFTGEGASQVAIDIARREHVAAAVKRDGHGAGVTLAAEHYAAQQRTIAELKLMSLVQHVLDREQRKGVVQSAYEREAAVEKLARTGRKSVLKRTTLLKSDVELMRRLLVQHYQPEFFEGTVDEVRARVRAKVLNTGYAQQVVESEPVADKIKRVSARAMLASKDPGVTAWVAVPRGAKRRVINSANWNQLQRNNLSAPIIARHEVAVATRQLKQDAKFLRSYALLDMADLSATQLAMDHDKARTEFAAWMTRSQSPAPATTSATHSAAARTANAAAHSKASSTITVTAMTTPSPTATATALATMTRTGSGSSHPSSLEAARSNPHVSDRYFFNLELPPTGLGGESYC